MRSISSLLLSAGLVLCSFTADAGPVDINTADASTLVPSVALMPLTFFCDTRITGAAGEPSTGCALCPLWQSTHVAWRLLFSSASSVAS